MQDELYYYKLVMDVDKVALYYQVESGEWYKLWWKPNQEFII